MIPNVANTAVSTASKVYSILGNGSSLVPLAIKDVANMVGFKTVQHFNRIFKEIAGTTPAEFRKSSVQKRKDEIK